MDMAEYYSVQMEILAHVSNVFEIWLGFTFAAVAAFHLGAEHLTKALFRVSQALYLMASLLFVIRYFALMGFLGQISERIIDAGGQPLALPTYFGMTIVFLIVVIFVTGTLMTIVFSNHRFKNRVT